MVGVVDVPWVRLSSSMVMRGKPSSRSPAEPRYLADGKLQLRPEVVCGMAVQTGEQALPQSQKLPGRRQILPPDLTAEVDVRIADC